MAKITVLEWYAMSSMSRCSINWSKIHTFEVWKRLVDLKMHDIEIVQIYISLDEQITAIKYFSMIIIKSNIFLDIRNIASWLWTIPEDYSYTLFSVFCSIFDIHLNDNQMHLYCVCSNIYYCNWMIKLKLKTHSLYTLSTIKIVQVVEISDILP